MGLWDKIKNFFNRGKNEVKALPEATSNNRNPYGQATTLRRKDGSSIMITPRVDKVGNPMFQTILNHRTGEIQYIPEYNIIDDALKNARTTHGSTISSIYMDIDSKLLGDEDYNYYIADVLLAPERIAEIIDNNQRYAGGVNIDESGRIGCYNDEGVIQGLKANQKENQQRYAEQQKERDRMDMEMIKSNAKNKDVHIEKNGEQILSPEDMYFR